MWKTLNQIWWSPNSSAKRGNSLVIAAFIVVTSQNAHDSCWCWCELIDAVKLRMALAVRKFTSHLLLLFLQSPLPAFRNRSTRNHTRQPDAQVRTCQKYTLDPRNLLFNLLLNGICEDRNWSCSGRQREASRTSLRRSSLVNLRDSTCPHLAKFIITSSRQKQRENDEHAWILLVCLTSLHPVPPWTWSPVPALLSPPLASSPGANLHSKLAIYIWYAS